MVGFGAGGIVRTASFWQAWKKVVSPDYFISVTDRPIMEEFSITVIPPDYSGLPANIQQGNQADVKGLKGSRLYHGLFLNTKIKFQLTLQASPRC